MSGDMVAKPIAPTPVLEGKDAQLFLEQLEKDRTVPNPEKVKFLKECMETYKSLNIR